MLLKLISANLRGSPLLCSALHAVSSRVNPTSRRRILQITQISSRSSTLQYSTEKAASNATKADIRGKATSNENEQLSPEEVQMLNQDPDSFGTLSSFKPLTTEGIQNEPEVEVDRKTGTSSEKTMSKQESVERYEALMKDLIDKGNVKQAVDLFESEMLMKDRIHAPARIYVWLINECIHSSEVKKAFDIYEHMINRQIGISFGIVEKLISAFELSTVSIKKVHSLQKVLSKYQYKMNDKMYNALVRIYARSTQWSIGLVLADDMKEGGFKYDLETINAIFDACSHDKENGFNRLIELWHELHRLEYIPNVHTFNAFLNGVKNCELKNVDKLKKTIESIRAKCPTSSNQIDDGRPNLLQCPPKIGFLFPLERVEKPEDRLLILGGLTGLLKEFKKYDISPTLDTITTLLNIVPNTFEAHQRVISLLQKNQMVPDRNLFNVLLTKNCMKQRYQNTKVNLSTMNLCIEMSIDFIYSQEIIEMMYMADVEVDLVSYGLLAMSCSNRAEAEDFFDEMNSRNKK